MADITVTLPDGSSRVLPSGATVLDLAAAIGAGLAKAAIAGRVDDRLVDLAAPLWCNGCCVAVRSSFCSLIVQRH